MCKEDRVVEGRGLQRSTMYTGESCGGELVIGGKGRRELLERRGLYRAQVGVEGDGLYNGEY